MMKIAFDAKRAYQNGTGLGHYSRTLISSLAQYFPEHEYSTDNAAMIALTGYLRYNFSADKNFFNTGSLKQNAGANMAKGDDRRKSILRLPNLRPTQAATIRLNRNLQVVRDNGQRLLLA